MKSNKFCFKISGISHTNEMRNKIKMLALS